MKPRHVFQQALVVISVGVVMTGYTNCSDMHADSRSIASFASAESCNEVRFDTYKTQVYPFFRSEDTCLKCHKEGGTGMGQFASEDLQKAFDNFNAAGMTKIAYMATNPEHKPPNTGEHNKPAISAMETLWISTERTYLECVSKAENGGVDVSLLTSAKNAPSIYATEGATETLTWDLNLGTDLDVSVTRSVPAQISIDVKLLYTVSATDVKTLKGYAFSNPRMRLTDASAQLIVEGLFFQINGKPITGQTTFTSLSRVVTGTSWIPLMPATANTLISPVGAADQFQLYLRRILPTSGVEDAPAPMTPVLTLRGTDSKLTTHTNNREVDVSILRDASVMRWCLTTSPTPPASTEASCVNGETANNVVNGWHLTRPSKFTLPDGDGSKTVYLYVANEYLKINEVPAQATIELDRVAPAVATISTPVVGDTQVASLSVTHDGANVTGWCVYERRSSSDAAPRPELGDACWRWTSGNTKPTTVGFKEGGARDVWVFTRDLAGNISAASNKVTATNPWGAITLAQLTAEPATPRAIFTMHCSACHKDNGTPGAYRLNLWSYASVVEIARTNNGQTEPTLVTRTNDPLRPMPNVSGGLIDQRKRDLIRLWTMPDAGGDPVP